MVLSPSRQTETEKRFFFFFYSSDWQVYSKV